MGNIYLLSEEANKTIRDLMSLGMEAKTKLKTKINSCVPMVIFANIDSKELGHYDMSQNLIVLSTNTSPFTFNNCFGSLNSL